MLFIFYKSKGEIFDISLLQQTINYYNKRHYEIFVIISSSFNENRKYQISDSNHFQKLIENNFIHFTPSSDYDDSYCIDFAIKMNGVILSNDKYRDNVDNLSSSYMKEQRIKWFKRHKISFSFIGDMFVPNPDFIYPYDN